MHKLGLILFFLFLYMGCGVKGPPLPPMKSQDKVVVSDEGVESSGGKLSDLIGDEKENKNNKKKKRVNAPFQF